VISFTNKTFLITGAAGGIARATALLVARHGANVALSDVNPAALEVLQKELRDQVPQAQISTHVTDVADAEACRATVQAVARPASAALIIWCIRPASIRKNWWPT